MPGKSGTLEKGKETKKEIVIVQRKGKRENLEIKRASLMEGMIHGRKYVTYIFVLFFGTCNFYFPVQKKCF